jgi:hypothetical protein
MFVRAREYGQNRILAGVHYPTDIEGGRIGATVTAAALMQNAAFNIGPSRIRRDVFRDQLLSETADDKARQCPIVGSLRRTDSVAIGGIADIRRSLAARRGDAIDPELPWAAPGFCNALTFKRRITEVTEYPSSRVIPA